MDFVFLLWHTHQLEHGEDEKFLGVYRSETDAQAAINRLRGLPGLVQCPKGFEIAKYELNRDHWTDGYVVV